MYFRSLAAACLIAVPFASPLIGQSFAPKRELKNLSPAATDKLHTLDTLTALPAGDWRFHAGDIPHGESPTLDDSSWTVVQANSTAPNEAVWYRRTVVIPRMLHGYDIAGSRISFQFHADANGPMPQIIYFNGNRVALGDDLEPIPLSSFAPARRQDPRRGQAPPHRGQQALPRRHHEHHAVFHSSRPEPAGHPRRGHLRGQYPAKPSHSAPDLIPKVEQALAAIDFKALAAGNQPLFDEACAPPRPS